MKKFKEYMKSFLPLLFLIIALLLIWNNNFEKANYFVLFYVMFTFEDRLKDIKDSIDRLWYSIYLKNKED